MSQEELEIRGVLKTLLPAMEADGGGVELVSVNEGVVTVKFKGVCLKCPSINLTMKYGVTKTLKEKLPWIKDVVKLD